MKRRISVMRKGRVDDVYIKTLHTGGAFQSTEPVKIEVSKEMAPVKKRLLGPEDRRAIKDINNILEGLGLRLQLEKNKAQSQTNRLPRLIKFYTCVVLTKKNKNLRIPFLIICGFNKRIFLCFN